MLVPAKSPIVVCPLLWEFGRPFELGRITWGVRLPSPESWKFFAWATIMYEVGRVSSPFWEGIRDWWRFLGCYVWVSERCLIQVLGRSLCRCLKGVSFWFIKMVVFWLNSSKKRPEQNLPHLIQQFSTLSKNLVTYKLCCSKLYSKLTVCDQTTHLNQTSVYNSLNLLFQTCSLKDFLPNLDAQSFPTHFSTLIIYFN